MQTNTDISKYTITELEAFAYRLLLENKTTQSNLAIVEARIKELKANAVTQVEAPLVDAELVKSE